MFRLPADAVEPEFVVLYDYWRGKCRDGRLPARRDIDPLDLPPALLPNIVLLDVERRGAAPRFRVRLAGTGFVALLEREATGCYFDELGHERQMAPILDALMTLVATGQPAFLASPMTRPSKDKVWLKRFALPLAEDGKTVDMILASFRPIAQKDRPDTSTAAE
ncbi:MAG: PAS domain-containing protein [Candidatus Eiseniibacteriota bacterium]